MAQIDDRELVRRFLIDRREDLFRELYHRHANIVYRVSVRLLASSDRTASGTPEDATQECWLRAVRGLAAFNWNSQLSTWLVGIAFRVCAEMRRASAEVLRLEEYEDQLQGAESLLPELDRVDTERLLLRVAAGYRIAVILHDLEGLTHEEIAAALNVAPGTVKSQLARGRRALRAAAGQSDVRTGKIAP